MLLALALPVQPAELILQDGLDGYDGAGDNSIYQDQVENTNGGHGFLYSGLTKVSSPRRFLIRFDLTALPSGAVVLGVELRLTVNRAGLNQTNLEPHGLHRLTRPWGEGTVDSLDFDAEGGSGWSAEPGDATWLSASHGSVLWTLPGGDYVAEPSAVAGVGGVTGAGENRVEAQAFFAGEGLVADVQRWVDDPDSNFGWIGIGNEVTPQTARRIYSSDWEEADPEEQARRRPLLRITFQPMNSATLWGLYP